ncbi:MAG: helix-turn-helix domain-containing protein [Erythrobacter sp.]
MQARLEAAANPLGQRGEPRRRLFLSGSASQTGASCEVLVHNLSSTGMLLSTQGRLDLDEPLVVVFAEIGECLARIVWSAEGLFGCRFDEPLTKAQMSAILLRSEPLQLPPRPITPVEEAPQAEAFGERIRRLRRQSGLSMVDFANSFGVTKPTLWKWETGRAHPRQAVLRRLADRFGMSEQELLFGPGERPARAQPPDHRPVRPGTLAETVARSRTVIAREAGVSPSQVSIAIDWS